MDILPKHIPECPYCKERNAWLAQGIWTCHNCAHSWVINPPKHVVHIIYDPVHWYYKLYCTVCGMFPRSYETLEKATNRKSTHDRGQDAGVDD